VLSVGQAQTLSAVFTPNDTYDYKTVNASTTINVTTRRRPTVDHSLVASGTNRRP